jgi:hypothetical protein
VELSGRSTGFEALTPDDDVVPGLTLEQGRNVLVAKVGQGVGGRGVSARFEKPGGGMLALSGN